MIWEDFFPQGTAVMALPNWDRPKLYLPSQSLYQRWKGSSLCPNPQANKDAFLHLPSPLGRYLSRAKAAAGLLPLQKASTSDVLPIQEFVGDALPQFSWMVMLLGAPGPAQKITFQLWDAQSNIVGYLKYSDIPLACQRIEQEYQVLSNITQGPTPLKYGSLGTGKALLTSPISGKYIAAKLPPDNRLLQFLQGLIVSDPVPLSDHPWFHRVKDRAEKILLRSLEALKNRDWPIALQHGDLLPSNLLLTPGGNICAIDWEYGYLKGFPYMDLTCYILEVSAFYYHWSPLQAMQYIVEFLCRPGWPNLTSPEAEAIVRLTAWQSYQQFLKDGHSSAGPFQPWLKSVWQCELS